MSDSTTGPNAPPEDRPSWARRRPYRHIDRSAPPEVVVAYCSSAEKLAKHAYLPLIRRCNAERRYRSDYDDDGVRQPPAVGEKRRFIDMASHRDAAIFGMFAEQARQRLERIYAEQGLGDVVGAFRPNHGSHIQVARSAFDDIRSRPSGCIAVSLDVKGFYDSIAHAPLKKAWERLLGVDRLPRPEYQAFRAITRYSTIDHKRLHDFLMGHWRASGFPKQEVQATRICTMAEFRAARAAELVQTNRADHGIPQGTALSNVLTNVLMLDLDRRVHRLASASGASYRRYCDDILLIGDREAVDRLEQLIRQELKALNLSCHDQFPKRSEAEFRPNAEGGFFLVNPDKLMQYLGFTFDGRQIRLRSGTVSRYYQRMAEAVDRAMRKAGRAGLDRVPRQRLYARFTVMGDKGPGARLIDGQPKHRHNFLSYAQQAARIMDSPAIMRQMRHHMEVLTERLHRADKELAKEKALDLLGSEAEPSGILRRNEVLRFLPPPRWR